MRAELNANDSITTIKIVKHQIPRPTTGPPTTAPTNDQPFTLP